MQKYFMQSSKLYYIEKHKVKNRKFARNELMNKNRPDKFASACEFVNFTVIEYFSTVTFKVIIESKRIIIYISPTVLENNALLAF